MKKSILTAVVFVLLAPFAQAGELFCGASIEQTPGSQIYNKSLFWEKAEVSKAVTRFLLSDGTLLKSESLTSETFAKIVDGTLVIGVSTVDGRLNIFSARVKKDSSNHLNFESLAMAASMDGGTPLLVANSVSIVCKEM